MTSIMDIIAARHCQTAAHNAIVRRNLPTLLRIDTSNADPIVDAHALGWPDGIDANDRTIVGYYQRRGYGDDEPYTPVYAGDTSLVRCQEAES